MERKSRKLIFFALLVVILAIISYVASFYKKQESPSNEIQNYSKEDVSNYLVKNTWCTPTGGDVYPIWTVKHTFRTDGTYLSGHFLYDSWENKETHPLEESENGRWNLERINEGWFIVFDKNETWKLSIDSRKSSLTLNDGYPFYPCNK